MTAVRAILRSAILTAGAVLGAVCILWTAGLLIAGITPLVLLSGSMSPALRPGDVAFAHAVPAAEVEIGDVVSVTSLDGVRITHRVVDASPDEAGTTVLRLKGDANTSADSATYALASVLKVETFLPGGGRVLQAAASPGGIAFGLALLTACLILGWRPPRVPRSSEDRRRPNATRNRRGVGFAVLAVVPLLVLGSAAAPQSTIAYYTDTPTVQTGTNGLDAAPWFTCHQAMSSTALGAFAYYRFNESVGATTAVDSSGNNRAAQMRGVAGTSYAFAQIQPCARDTDTGVRFDGSTGYASSPNVGGLGGVAGARWNTFTLAVWFRGDTANAGGALIGMSEVPGGGNMYDRMIYVDGVGRLHFAVVSGGQRTLVTPAVGQPGYIDFRSTRWHLVTASLSPAGMKLSVDGELLPLTTTAEGVSAASITTSGQYPGTAYWNIGNTRISGWPGAPLESHWKGFVSKVGIWDKALTDQQIRDLYRAGIPLRG